MDASFPSVWGFVSRWEIRTPFGFDYFNGDSDKTTIWKNIHYKLNNTNKEFKACLKDKEKGWLHNKHISWQPVKSDNCCIFDFSINLDNNKGTIKLKFHIKMDKKDEEAYNQVIASFLDKIAIFEIQNSHK